MNDGESCPSEKDEDDKVLIENPLFYASLSDSDSSPDSGDSFELSESESITDVTPLNSPYCDSPISQGRSAEAAHFKDYYAEQNKGEVNVLMLAIRKLELERASPRGKKYGEGPEAGRRGEASEGGLRKQVMSGRVKASSSQERLHRKSTVINRRSHLASNSVDAEKAASNDSPTATASGNQESAQKHAQRQVKCLSHPCSSRYTFAVLEKQVQCRKELKALESVKNAVVNGPESVSEIDSDVIAH